ncbi:DUF4352 domain-containing protein [Streptomyces sp. NPDC002547]
MSQQYPPNPQQPNQPGYGYPQQPGQPQPGWGAPQQPWGMPPQPPKKGGAGKAFGIGCLSIIGLFVVFGIIAAVAGSGGSDDKKSTSSKPAASAPAEQPADDAPAAKPESDDKPAPAPVKVTAKKTNFQKTLFADGSYTSVLVTVVNNSDDTINVNPLYFQITDTKGTKHTAELAVDDRQIDSVDLAPGENVTGTITGKGSFTANYVTYTDGWFGDSVRVKVS